MFLLAKLSVTLYYQKQKDSVLQSSFPRVCQCFVHVHSIAFMLIDVKIFQRQTIASQPQRLYPMAKRISHVSIVVSSTISCRHVIIVT